QAAAHLKAERAHRIADRAGTANRARRPVKGGEEAVARGVDLTPAVLLQHRASLGVERLEQLAPGMVSSPRYRQTAPWRAHVPARARGARRSKRPRPRRAARRDRL